MNSRIWILAALLALQVFFLADKPNFPNLFAVILTALSLVLCWFALIPRRPRPDLTRPPDRNKPDGTNR